LVRPGEGQVRGSRMGYRSSGIKREPLGRVDSRWVDAKGERQGKRAKSTRDRSLKRALMAQAKDLLQRYEGKGRESN